MKKIQRRLVHFIAHGGHLVILQFILMFIFAICPVWQPILDTNTFETLSIWRISFAAIPAFIALLFGGLGSHHLRDYLTPSPYPVEHNQLVSHGIYAIVRHPLYASLLFLGLSWTVYSLSLSHMFLLIVAGGFFDYKAGREEQWLTALHPDYANYAQRVHKFVPWIY
ncbi:isoprenylcysteine carboxylmethyltransferase family protein [Rhodoferax sp. 4810]|uniref:Isoprenylcysteine carboxylmethyltransferase family protein n=2 Tax=Thiospirillum jenense TaxID=1653858 RepID=A0A839HLZ9_9GAMM|nr:isoprenylcysteine carboxylmethyltransferase family protein [Rhodoferax jenense]MBB1127279.1 isoprenylcysteine carboxylmethyltransferase family protein [Thiospirillum jenense]